MKDYAYIIMKKYEKELKEQGKSGVVHKCALETIGGLRAVAAQFNIELPEDSIEYEMSYAESLLAVTERWLRFLNH